MERSPTLIEWLMVLATFGGPLVGIWVTRFIDSANDKQRRREAVFQGLLRTRGLELSPDHVSNLNMVPLVFKEQAVLGEYSKIMAALNDTDIGSPDPERSGKVLKRLAEARFDMLREIGKVVGTPLPEKEAERYGYAPAAWQNEYMETSRLRQAVLEIVEGRKSLPMIAGVYELPPLQVQPQQDQGQIDAPKPERA